MIIAIYCQITRFLILTDELEVNGMEVVRANIKRLVHQGGLKQSAVANNAKIPEKQFSALICGRKVIRPEHIASIATALGVTPNDLFNVNTESPNPSA